LTERSAASLAMQLGADRTTAESVGTAVDIAVPIAVSAAVGAARLLSIRFGRITLAEHEASTGSRLGGHTIAKHVGKTEAELRARLVAEPRRQFASTFKSLDCAERVIYRAPRSNKRAIEAWAKTARPFETREFYYTAGDTIGSALLRATDQIYPSRTACVVLKMQPYNGELYYILTTYLEV